MSFPVSPNWFDQTPDSAYLRERQLLGDTRDPNGPKLLPISRATLWRMVREGRFPSPHKLGPNTTAWLCGDVRRYLRNLSKSNTAQSQSLVIDGEVISHE